MIDERFITHRFKATRLPVLVGVVLMLESFTYAYLSRGAIRWDLFVIMLATAVTKTAAMFYYGRTN